MFPKQQFLIKDLNDLEKLADFILPYLKPNTFLLLQGDLGVGKTTFSQVIAKKLGVKEKVSSPTFTICQQYKTKYKYQLNHLDFFRLSPQDDISLFEELTIDNLNIIEWPERNYQLWQNKKCFCLFFKFQLLGKQELRLVEIDWKA